MTDFGGQIWGDEMSNFLRPDWSSISAAIWVERLGWQPLAANVGTAEILKLSKKVLRIVLNLCLRTLSTGNKDIIIILGVTQLAQSVKYSLYYTISVCNWLRFERPKIAFFWISAPSPAPKDRSTDNYIIFRSGSTYFLLIYIQILLLVLLGQTGAEELRIWKFLSPIHNIFFFLSLFISFSHV